MDGSFVNHFKSSTAQAPTLGGGTWNLVLFTWFLNYFGVSALAGVAQLVGVSSCTPKGLRFDP